MTNISNIPFVDTAGYNSNNRFHVDGTNENLKDAVRYLENVVQFEDELPKTKTEYNELVSWIKAFNWSYERIPNKSKI